MSCWSFFNWADLREINWRECSVTWSARFLSHMNHVSVSPTDGTGPTQGQRKTLTRVGIEPMTFGLDLRRSTDWATRSGGSRPWELKMLKSRQLKCTSARKGYVYTNVGRVALIFFNRINWRECSVTWSAGDVNWLYYISQIVRVLWLAKLAGRTHARAKHVWYSCPNKQNFPH